MIPFRRGELSPMMYLVLGMMLLIALLVVIFGLRDKSFGIVEAIGRMFS